MEKSKDMTITKEFINSLLDVFEKEIIPSATTLGEHDLVMELIDTLNSCIKIKDDSKTNKK
jgi:hypothetical protein